MEYRATTMPVFWMRDITLFLFGLSRRGESAGHVKNGRFAPTWNAIRTKSGAFQTCTVRTAVRGGVLHFAICQSVSDDRSLRSYWACLNCFRISAIWRH